MRKAQVLLPLLAIIVVAVAMIACGSSNRVSNVPNGQLQSVTITPGVAGSKAQFVATGFYSDGSKVTPLPALWFPITVWYKEANAVQWINLDATGSASCNANSGTYNVVATAPVDPHLPLSQMQESTPQVFGTAQLTCP